MPDTILIEAGLKKTIERADIKIPPTKCCKLYQEKGLKTKVIFINDGPGLLLGSMWNDYSEIEDRHKETMVLTLRMIPVRLTLDWLKS